MWFLMGILENRIIEFYWWYENTFNGIQITFTPTHHFSGRRLTDKAKSLWGVCVLKTTKEISGYVVTAVM
jgi:L-ascorbate metabolism protein UlaG (beta-lactamase superfamily)